MPRKWCASLETCCRVFHFIFLRKTRVADFNLEFVGAERLAENSFFELPAPQQAAHADEIRFLGNCSGNEPLGEVSSLFPADLTFNRRNIMTDKKNSLEAAATPTPHNRAKRGQIAPTVILPGDPERAEWAARKFLKGAKVVSDIRGIKTFTGIYESKPVTIMASGMGMPSAGIYIYELYNFYGVQKIIRTGTCGALQKEIAPGEIILAMSASTDSNYAYQFELDGTFSPSADYELLRNAMDFAFSKKCKARVGMIFSSDFFSAYNAKGEREWKAWAKMGALGQDMETYALYCNAAFTKRKALSILTATVNLCTKKAAEDSEETLCPMMLMALSLA